VGYRVPLVSFAKGEIAPELYNRVDVAAYQASAKRARNVIGMRYGGLTMRPGTEFVGLVRGNSPTRLMPFQVSLDDEYLLELGDEYMRPAADGGYVLEEARAITAVATGGSTTITAPGHGWTVGDDVAITGVSGTIPLNGQVGRVIAASASTATLSVNSAGWPAYTGDGTAARLYTMPTPYTAANLPTLDMEQTANIAYVVSREYQQRRLTRLSHTSWSLVPVNFGPDITAPAGVSASATVANSDTENDGANYFPRDLAYVVTAVSASGQESRPSASVAAENDLQLKGNFNTVSWPAVPGAVEYVIYKSDTDAGVFGYAGTATGLTFRDDNIGPDYSDTPPTANNPLSGTSNYPACVAFHEQRLVLASSANGPNVVWMSQTANWENMDTRRPSVADDALAVRLVARKVNQISALLSMPHGLIAFTSGAIFSIAGADGGPIQAPANVQTKPAVARAAAGPKPLVVDNVAFYVTGKGGYVRTLGYNFEFDGQKSDNVSIYSPHFFDGFTIRSWAYMEHPFSCVWAARSDGKLLCFTWEQEQQVWGWTLCETAGVVEQVCVVTESGEDRLYMVVVRGGRRVLERMCSPRWPDQRRACYLDSAVHRSATTPFGAVHGLQHLEGREVSALLDGDVHVGMTVLNGSVTLPYEVTEAIVGLPYEAVIETLPLGQGGQLGSPRGKPQAIGPISVGVLNTRGIEVGTREGDLFPVKERLDEDWNMPTPLLSGFYHIGGTPSWGDDATVIIRQRHPLPMTITGVFFEPVVHA
jgi:hypothetical protein